MSLNLLQEHIRTRRGTSIDVVAVESHVAEEVADVGEEVVVGEVVVALRVDVEASSRGRTLPKN